MINRIIVSSDDSYFLDYWLFVTKAWKKFFPNVVVTLAYVTDENDENHIQNLRKYGEVYLFKPIIGIPNGNMAKMCRHILAGMFGNDVCMVEDIDTIPLQSDFINCILNERKSKSLLLVGKEVYDKTPDSGKIPISNMCGESYLFKELINPLNFDITKLIYTWCDIRIFDNKESINSPSNIFSDESLMRVLLNQSNIELTKINRNVNIHTDWIDRSWWNININKLLCGGYVCCNFLRPLKNNFKHMELLYNYIFNDVGINLDKIII